MRVLGHLLVLSVMTWSSAAFAVCSSFTASTMDVGGGTKAAWRTDYPASPGPSNSPWQAVSFKAEPEKYMMHVLDTVKPHFKRDGKKLVGTGSEPWWISPWMDYTQYGREPLMGLTKERGPNPGDLSPTNSDGYQVWAVGFYNTPGASVLGAVFSNPCDPQVPAAVNFPEGTVAIKFLFTDARPSEVTYLKGGPLYSAKIDATGSGSAPLLVADRKKRNVRLIQLDIAVKDKNAASTEWVFGTFGWVGPLKGDGLFDNLVPVSLQWSNDPKVYGTTLEGSWISPTLKDVMYGWSKRPTLGFNGRANGPADNIRSSCLSCHAAARIPRSSKGLLGFGFNMADINDAAKVKAHVDFWFEDLKAGDLFHSAEPAVSALDYSLQLESAIFRMCRACRAGDLSGTTPAICRTAKLYDQASCHSQVLPLDAVEAAPSQILEEVAPPRQ